MAEYRDEDHAVYESTSIEEEEQAPDEGRGRYWSARGTVTTRNTLVRVSASRYDRPDGTRYESSMLWFVMGGREYTRYFQRAYRPRYLVTLAKRFAAEKAETQI